MAKAELPERRATVLRIIVAEHIASAAPVASESIARGYALGISPATIRHEVARLEEEGYISRPHTSAGAVPSDKGYRYYVECLIAESKLSEADQLVIRRYFYEAEQEPEEWARLAVRVLTQKLESIAVATLPHAPVCRFRHVDLVEVQDLLVLLVLVLQGGRIRKRLFTPPEAMSQDELVACANKMNAIYQGLTSRQIGAQEASLSPVEEHVVNLVRQIMDTEDERRYEQLYLEGWRHLIGQTEFLKGNKMLNLVEALEEKDLIRSLLASAVDKSGIRITIGNENQVEALQECSVIVSNYGVEERRGAIGVIGPTRMRYSRAIPMVDYVSSIMTDLLASTYA